MTAMRTSQSLFGQQSQRSFAKKNDDGKGGPRKKTDLEIFEEQKRLKQGTRKASSDVSSEETEGQVRADPKQDLVEAKPKRKRRTKAEIEAERAAKLQQQSKP